MREVVAIRAKILFATLQTVENVIWMRSVEDPRVGVTSIVRIPLVRFVQATEKRYNNPKSCQEIAITQNIMINNLVLGFKSNCLKLVQYLFDLFLAFCPFGKNLYLEKLYDFVP